jgi:hypothetical protein
VADTDLLKNTISDRDKDSLKVSLIVFSSTLLLYLIIVIIISVLALGIRNIGNYYFSSRLISPFAILGYLFIYLKVRIKKGNIKTVLTIGIDFIIIIMLVTVIMLVSSSFYYIEHWIETLLQLVI